MEKTTFECLRPRCEPGAYVLAAMRRWCGVKLPKVRKALNYVREEFDVDRPFVDQAFQTDGLDLFVERYGQMINASRAGPHAMKEIASVYLRRIERDAGGLPIKLYPFTRATESGAGTGIPVAAILERYKAGDSVAELARDFRLETSAVAEAIRCDAEWRKAGR